MQTLTPPAAPPTLPAQPAAWGLYLFWEGSDSFHHMSRGTCYYAPCKNCGIWELRFLVQGVTPPARVPAVVDSVPDVVCDRCAGIRLPRLPALVLW